MQVRTWALSGFILERNFALKSFAAVCEALSKAYLYKEVADKKQYTDR
jgi:hypothetical protein